MYKGKSENLSMEKIKIKCLLRIMEYEMMPCKEPSGDRRTDIHDSCYDDGP